jgi:small subunit ribosomal protein S20
MPHHKSAVKRMRTNERDRKKNVAVKSAVKKATRGVRDDAKGKEAPKLLRDAQSLLDNAVRKGVIHRKTADRKKSRLAKLVNKSQPKTA